MTAKVAGAGIAGAEAASRLTPHLQSLLIDSYVPQMGLLGSLRKYIDREWAKVDWCGPQTFQHRLLAAAPLIVCGGAIGLFSAPYWIEISGILLAFAVFGLLTLWIEGRRLAGIGAFSTERSEKYIRRMNTERQKRADLGDEHDVR